MSRFWYVTLSAALTAVLAAGVVHAQNAPGRRGGPGLHGPGFGPGAGLPLRELNLSEAQQEQIRMLTEQSREQHQPVAERMRAALDAQRKAVETVPVDEQLIRATTAALADAQAEVAIQHARLRAEIFSLLTPEQQATAKKLQAERQARWQERHRPRSQ